MTMYLAENRYSSAKITPVEVEKETVSTVWLMGGRMRRRISESECYFNTFESAKKWLLGRAEAECGHVRRQLETANSKLGNIKGLQP